MIQKEKTNTLGIVLKVSPFKEDSAIVSFGGKKGVFSLLVKGVHKKKSPFKPVLFVGSILDLEYLKTDDDFGILKGCESLLDSSDLFQKLSCSAFLFYLSELSSRLFHYEDPFPFEDVYLLLKKLKENGDVLSLTLLLLARFYHCLGIEMNQKCCVHCHSTKDIVSYSLKEGGFLCKNCLGENEEKKLMDLYVFKFAFSDLNPEILSKKVPFENGYRLLLLLEDYLLDYFDLKDVASFSFLLKTLSDEFVV